MAEKLVNGTGLGEFASKIKESVPLLGNSSAGTVPLVGTDMIADGAITQSKFDSTLLSKLAYMPGESITVNGDFSFSCAASANTIVVTIPLNKSLGLISSVTATTSSSVASSYGFIATNSNTSVLNYNPRVKAGQTVNGTIFNVGVIFRFETHSEIPATLWANGVIRINDLTINFS